MKTFFIEAKYIEPIKLDKSEIAKLPAKIGLLSTTQFTHQLGDVKNQLESAGKKVFIEKGTQRHPGQILGCDVSAAAIIEKDVDAFLYIGDGIFHPIGAGLETDKAVFIYNPFTNKSSKLEKKDIEAYKKRKKAGLLKFHSGKNIGVLVSTKQGQASMSHLKLLRNKYPEKTFYAFVFDTLDFKQLENFPFVEAWVNTACPRIDEDLTLVNTRDVV